MRHFLPSSFRISRTPHASARHFCSSSPSRDAAHTTPPALTHIDAYGRASMVDVSAKEPTKRTATASGRIYIPEVAFELVNGATKTPDAPSGAEPISALEAAKAKARSKGDILTVAQLAAIMGCKRTAELIPLCHPLQLSHIAVTLHPETHRALQNTPYATDDDINDSTTSDVGTPRPESAPRGDRRLRYSIACCATVSCEGKTGVEMEALTAVSIGLLTVWDMLKAVAGKEMTIGDIVVDRKDGGKSGDFVRAPRRP